MKRIEIFGENRWPQYSKVRKGCRGILVRDDEILLSYESNADQWLIPGGGLENEENLDECCRRELAEETGIVVMPHTHYLCLEEYYHEYYFESHYFVCKYLGECERNLTDAEKRRGLEPRWIDLNEALKIFGEYEKYKDTNEIRYGAYYREHLALKEFLKLQGKI